MVARQFIFDFTTNSTCQPEIGYHQRKAKLFTFTNQWFFTAPNHDAPPKESPFKPPRVGEGKDLILRESRMERTLVCRCDLVNMDGVSPV